MLAREARKLGVELHVQTPDPEDPAVREATSLVLGSLDDVEATRALARRAERISFENEWASLAALEPLAREGIPFLPDLTSLAPLVDKRSQRDQLSQLNLPTPHWAGLEACLLPDPDPIAELVESEALDQDWPLEGSLHARPLSPLFSPVAPRVPRLPEGLTFPVVAKMARGGYDGKGTRILADQDALEALLASVTPEEWILEELVRFDMELAQVVCRDLRGEVRCFPLVRTHQRDHVCEWVLSPAPVGQDVQAYARNVAMSLVTSLNYVGVMGIEFFFGPRGLMVNEVAPRVHNSGHLTLEACATNQFAQQVRIVAGLPLGPTDATGNGALMVNLLGTGLEDSKEGRLDHLPQRQALEALPGARVHWYGKRPRRGRKLGHVTFGLNAESDQAREEEGRRRLEEVRSIWPWPEGEDP
jgi:5-(carboxyamino)imidazole ribonucleotide synthase